MTKGRDLIHHRKMQAHTHSGNLFVTKDGQPMRFYVRPGPQKKKLMPLIIGGGGVMCRIQEPGAFLLADPDEGCTEPGYVSTTYITDCVSRKRSLSPRAYRLLPPWDRSKNTVRNKSPLFPKNPTKVSLGKGNKDNPMSTMTHPGDETEEPENSMEQTENTGTIINYGEEDNVNMSSAGRAGIKQTVKVCNDIPSNYTGEEVARALEGGHKKMVVAAVHSASTEESSCQEGGQDQPPASSKTALEQELSEEVIPDLIIDMVAVTDHERSLGMDKESLLEVEYTRPKRKLRTDRRQSSGGIQQISNVKQPKVMIQADGHKIPNDIHTTVQNMCHSSEAQDSIEKKIEQTAEVEISALEKSTAEKSDNWPTEKQAELETSPVSTDPLKQGRVFFTEEEDIAILQYVRDNVSSKMTAKGTLLWKEMEERKVLNRTWQAMKGRYIHHLANKKCKVKHARLFLDNKDSEKNEVSNLKFENETCSSPSSNVDPEKSSTDSYSSSPEAPRKSNDKQPGVSVKTPQRRNTTKRSFLAVTPQRYNTPPCGSSSETLQKQNMPHCSSAKILQRCNTTPHRSKSPQKPSTTEHSFLADISQRPSTIQLSSSAQDPQRSTTIQCGSLPDLSQSSTAQHNSYADTPQRHATRRRATVESPDRYSITQHGSSLKALQRCNDIPLSDSTQTAQICIEVARTLEGGHKKLAGAAAVHSASTEEPMGQEQPPASSKTAVEQELSEKVIPDTIKDLEAGTDHENSLVMDEKSLLKTECTRPKRKLKTDRHESSGGIQQISNAKHCKVINQAVFHEIARDVQTTVQNICHSSEAQDDIEESIEQTAEVEISALEHSTAKKSDNRPTEKQAELETPLVCADPLKRVRRFFTEEEDAAILQYVRDNVSHKRTVTGTLLWKDMEKRKVLNRTWQAMKARYREHLAKIKKKNLKHVRLSPKKCSVKIEPSKLETAKETCSTPSPSVNPQKSSTDSYSSSPETHQRSNDKQPGVSLKSPQGLNATQHGPLPKTPERCNTIQHSSSAVTPQRLNAPPRGSSIEVLQKHITSHCSADEALQRCNTKQHGSETLQRPNTTGHSSLAETPQRLSTSAQNPQRPDTIRHGYSPETSQSSTEQHDSLADTPQRRVTTQHGSSALSHERYSITQHGSSLETPQKCNGIPPSDSTQTLQICETTEMGTSGVTPQRCDRTKHSGAMLSFSPAKSPFPHGETSGDMGDLHIFEIANMEFEIDDPINDGEEAPAADPMEERAGTSGPPPAEEPSGGSEAADTNGLQKAITEMSGPPPAEEPSGGSEAADSNGLQKAITEMMREFQLNISCVMDALYLNNGDLGSTRHFLRTGSRPDGYPIWEPQDDSDLKLNNPSTQRHLIEKYGADNVAKRLAFFEFAAVPRVSVE